VAGISAALFFEALLSSGLAFEMCPGSAREWPVSAVFRPFSGGKRRPWSAISGAAGRPRKVNFHHGLYTSPPSFSVSAEKIIFLLTIDLANALNVWLRSDRR
jgi:hypothetical protein